MDFDSVCMEKLGLFIFLRFVYILGIKYSVSLSLLNL